MRVILIMMPFLFLISCQDTVGFSVEDGKISETPVVSSESAPLYEEDFSKYPEGSMLSDIDTKWEVLE